MLGRVVPTNLGSHSDRCRNSVVKISTHKICFVCVKLILYLLFSCKAWENKDDALPWGTLRYLIGEAMYGGRVSDSYDRRILVTYLDEYLGDFLFDTFQPFYFYKNEHIEYRCLILQF